MTYRITFSPGVEALILDQAIHLRKEGAGEAVVLRWITELYGLLEALREYPRLYPKAELVSRAVGYEVRRLNHGEYAAFYRVHDDRRTIEVLDFRHGRMKPQGHDSGGRDQ